MQPFLSGETTLALLLITLTLLLFAAAGDEHPYEPYHRNFDTMTQRSSVELDQPPVQAKELTIKLDVLKQQQQQQQPEVMRRSFGRALQKPEPKTNVLRSSSLTSRLPSRFRPRNLQILAALLSHQSLHTMNMPVLKPDISWSLGGLGLPLMKTVRGRSLRCQRRRSVKYVSGGEEARQRRDESNESATGSGRVSERVVEVGD